MLVGAWSVLAMEQEARASVDVGRLRRVALVHRKVNTRYGGALVTSFESLDIGGGFFVSLESSEKFPYGLDSVLSGSRSSVKSLFRPDSPDWRKRNDGHGSDGSQS